MCLWAVKEIFESHWGGNNYCIVGEFLHVDTFCTPLQTPNEHNISNDISNA